MPSKLVVSAPQKYIKNRDYTESGISPQQSVSTIAMIKLSPILHHLIALELVAEMVLSYLGQTHRRYQPRNISAQKIVKKGR